jgi:hypothetical protein
VWGSLLFRRTERKLRFIPVAISLKCLFGMEGGMPQKVSENAWYATWSSDGNYLAFRPCPPTGADQIVDGRTGKKSTIPSSEGLGGFWMAQDTLVTSNQKQNEFPDLQFKDPDMERPGSKKRGQHRELDDLAR